MRIVLQTEPKRPYWCLHCSAMGAIRLSLVAMSTIMGLLVVPEKKKRQMIEFNNTYGVLLRSHGHSTPRLPSKMPIVIIFFKNKLVRKFCYLKSSEKKSHPTLFDNIIKGAYDFLHRDCV
jgi:hypothetical protein